jgi:hypothetical protein
MLVASRKVRDESKLLRLRLRLLTTFFPLADKCSPINIQVSSSGMRTPNSGSLNGSMQWGSLWAHLACDLLHWSFKFIARFIGNNSVNILANPLDLSTAILLERNRFFCSLSNKLRTFLVVYLLTLLSKLLPPRPSSRLKHGLRYRPLHYTRRYRRSSVLDLHCHSGAPWSLAALRPFPLR